MSEGKRGGKRGEKVGKERDVGTVEGRKGMKEGKRCGKGMDGEGKGWGKRRG